MEEFNLMGKWSSDAIDKAVEIGKQKYLATDLGPQNANKGIAVYEDEQRHAAILAPNSEMDALVHYPNLCDNENISGVLVAQSHTGVSFFAVYKETVEQVVNGELPFATDGQCPLFGSGLLYTHPTLSYLEQADYSIAPCTSLEKLQMQECAIAVFAVEYKEGTLRVLQSKQPEICPTGTVLIAPDQIKRVHLVYSGKAK